MSMSRVLALSLLVAALAAANPTVETSPGRISIRGERYTLGLSTERFAPELELRLNDGPPIRIEAGDMLMVVQHAGDDLAAQGRPATFAHQTLELRNGIPERYKWFEELSESLGMAPETRAELVGQTVVLDQDQALLLSVHFLCMDRGVLIGASVQGGADGNVWSPPRLTLHPDDWSRYMTFKPDEPLAVDGALADLAPLPAYVGVTPWGTSGVTMPKLDPSRPAVVLLAKGGGGLAVAQHDSSQVANGSCFIQRHTPRNLYFYTGMVAAANTVLDPAWAWLLPIDRDDPKAVAARVTHAESVAAAMTDPEGYNLKLIAPAPPKSWTDPLPDFPADLRHAEPVEDINDAMVYTMAESTRNESALSMARKVGSDMLVRGWFKWNQRPKVEDWTDVPKQANAFGALFGGGITCSALYDTENGITREQLLDMATRGPDGKLVDAWETPGVRHGTHSNPAHLDYLFRWCREQIDAGVDYLFMDEPNAALMGTEGFDDYSVADFREFLLRHWERTAGWSATDPRWTSEFRVDLADKDVCPDGTMASFLYRGYLKAHGFVDVPWQAENSLAGAWGQFRTWRDDRAWKSLTDRIRDYAKSQGRTVYISGNGIIKYVDLQVLGVWGRWKVADGHITLDENQVPIWRSLVLQGLATAGRDVPVVFFHDWGFGDPPFPFLGVPREDRLLWMRVRAAEIYAAGGKFAYPVLGPFGCDAQLDGSLPEIANQTRFWQTHRADYLGAQYLGSDKLSAEGGPCSLIATQPKGGYDLLLHVINRQLADHALAQRENVAVTVPGLPAPTRAVAVSPDFAGEQVVQATAMDGSLQVIVPSLDAYTVVRLSYDELPDLSALKDPIQVIPPGRWARPREDQFAVLPAGLVRDAHELNGFLQGNLHPDLRRPPTFLVNALTPARLTVEVRAVATLGAIIVGTLDGQEIARYELPDKDGSNDGSLPEYNQALTFDIPAGEHRLTIANVGGDWATIVKYRFDGTFGPP